MELLVIYLHYAHQRLCRQLRLMGTLTQFLRVGKG